MAILTPEMMTSLNDMTLGGVLVATGYLVALVSVRALKHLTTAVGVPSGAKSKTDNARYWSNEQWAAYQAKYAQGEAEFRREQVRHWENERSHEWHAQQDELLIRDYDRAERLADEARWEREKQAQQKK